MDARPHLDWNLIRALLAVAETGSLSAAARRLGQSQPTLGRQIREAEAQLGTDLFLRRARGLVLSPAGEALIPHARAMAEAEARLHLALAGQEAELSGTVRITASMMVAAYHLPPILARLRADSPGIEIELVPSDVSANLLFREADIALRMYRPRQLDLVARHLGDLPLGMFAARSYLARRGVPTDAEDLLRHDLIGYDSQPDIVDGFRAAGIPVTRNSFALRVDDNLTYWALVKAGAGIGFGQVALGRSDPDLVELPPGLPLPRLPVWLTAPAALRAVPRVAHVWDRLAEGLLAIVAPP